MVAAAGFKEGAWHGRMQGVPPPGMLSGVLAGTSVPVLLPIPGRQAHVSMPVWGSGGVTPPLGFGERDGEMWGTVLWEYRGAVLGDSGYGTMQCEVQDWEVWGAAAATGQQGETRGGQCWQWGQPGSPKLPV